MRARKPSSYSCSNFKHFFVRIFGKIGDDNASYKTFIIRKTNEKKTILWLTPKKENITLNGFTRREDTVGWLSLQVSNDHNNSLWRCIRHVKVSVFKAKISNHVHIASSRQCFNSTDSLFRFLLFTEKQTVFLFSVSTLPVEQFYGQNSSKWKCKQRAASRLDQSCFQIPAHRKGELYMEQLSTSY